MKRISLLSIITVLIMLILSSQGCKNKVTPGCLYDLIPATPTPSAPLWISVNVKDINLSGTPVPVIGLTITAQSGSLSITTTTGTDGTAALEVFGYGDHIIKISGNIISGYPADLTYTVHVNNTLTYYNIVRNQPSFTFGLEAGYSTTYAYLTTTVKYDIVYHTNTKKHCDLSLVGMAYPQISATFDPSYVENDGDKSILTLVTPKYFESGGYASKVTFVVQGMYSNTLPTVIGKDALIQNWEFKPVLSGNYYSIGSHNTQFDFSISLPGNSINCPISDLKVVTPQDKMDILNSTPRYWTNINGLGSIWEYFSIGGMSQQTYSYIYTYPILQNVNGSIIYHFMTGSDGNYSGVRVTFIFFTDDGFSKTYAYDSVYYTY
jgi:hypothetical protein